MLVLQTEIKVSTRQPDEHVSNISEKAPNRNAFSRKVLVARPVFGLQVVSIGDFRSP